MVGIEGQDGEESGPARRRQPSPPLRNRTEHVEGGAAGRVGEQQAAAAVHDVRLTVQREELQPTLPELAGVVGGAREPGLSVGGAAMVEDGGGEQRQPAAEIVVVGDEAVPCLGDALEPEERLEGKPGEDLHGDVIVRHRSRMDKSYITRKPENQDNDLNAVMRYELWRGVGVAWSEREDEAACCVVALLAWAVDVRKASVRSVLRKRKMRRRSGEVEVVRDGVVV